MHLPPDRNRARHRTSGISHLEAWVRTGENADADPVTEILIYFCSEKLSGSFLNSRTIENDAFSSNKDRGILGIIRKVIDKAVCGIVRFKRELAKPLHWRHVTMVHLPRAPPNPSLSIYQRFPPKRVYRSLNNRRENHLLREKPPPFRPNYR